MKVDWLIFQLFSREMDQTTLLRKYSAVERKISVLNIQIWDTAKRRKHLHPMVSRPEPVTPIHLPSKNYFFQNSSYLHIFQRKLFSKLFADIETSLTFLAWLCVKTTSVSSRIQLNGLNHGYLWNQTSKRFFQKHWLPKYLWGRMYVRWGLGKQQRDANVLWITIRLGQKTNLHLYGHVLYIWLIPPASQRNLASAKRGCTSEPNPPSALISPAFVSINLPLYLHLLSA